MLQTLIRKTLICFASLLLIVTCASCEASSPYYVSDYLSDLAMESGIGQENNYLDSLINWGVIEKDDINEDRLTYDYLIRSIGKLANEDYDSLVKKGWIDKNINLDEYVNYDEAKKIIDKAILQINNPSFDKEYEFELYQDIKNEDDELNVNDIYYDGDSYRKVISKDEYGISSKRAEFEEVFSSFELADSYEIDFDEAEIIPYYDETENVVYRNNYYELLASKKHHFNVEGFDVTYTVNASGINVHLSRNINDYDIYGDFSINNVKPKIKWSYKQGDLNNCYFSVDFKSSEKLGAEIGKYNDYYLKFKDLDSSSFSSLLNSLIKPVDDKVDISIPICKIKSPIPEIPTAFINLDLLLNLSASGKVQLQLFNSHLLGFETKNGQIRYINDCDRKFDSLISASASASAAINISAELAKYRLADVEINNGLRSEAKTTIHLFDEDGEKSSRYSNIAYTTLQEIAKENNDVKVCGDLSFYWLSNIIINTAKTKMYKYGMTATFDLSGEDNQVFGNLHHIENGHFVKECTRKARPALKKTEQIVSRRIVLDSYAEVLKLNNTYEIKVLALPEGYDIKALIYESSDNEVAIVDKGIISAKKPGNCRISISTADQKYSAYINILVSDS